MINKLKTTMVKAKEIKRRKVELDRLRAENDKMIHEILTEDVVVLLDWHRSRLTPPTKMLLDWHKSNLSHELLKGDTK